MAIGLPQSIAVKPVGLMDFRSDPSDIEVGVSRVLLNVAVTEALKPRRAAGWIKLFGESEFGFNNQDLHEQLIDLQGYYDEYSYDAYTIYDGYYDYDYCGAYLHPRGGCREAILHLTEFSSDSGARKLIAMTQKRWYEINERGGNWRLLADGLGSPLRNISDETCQPCAGPRWLSEHLLGYLVGVNGLNNVLAYKVGDAPDGCNLWSAKPIQELIDLNILRAGCVCQFKGFILIADVEQDGIRRPGRIFWSDFNAPLSWLPLPGTSLAGFADIGFSERVLRMEAMSDYVMVYTDQAIHRGQLVLRQEANGIISEVFHFTQIYRGPHALRYKFSLVNNGAEHLYASVDGIYVIANPFAGKPERVEWLHRADGAIYHGATRWSAELASLPDEITESLSFGPINEAACDNFIGEYNAITKEIWWSWATDENVCANVSLRVSLQYSAASIVDHGFTAFTMYRSDTRPTFAQWLESLKVCLASSWEGVKEGEMQGEETEFENPVPYIWNETEDPDAEIASDSMCAILGATTVQDICEGCDAPPIFIGASAADLTLKEFTETTYAREFYNGVGYTLQPYSTLIQSGAMDFASDSEKAFSEIIVGFKALAQTTPSLLYAQAGFGAQAECPTWRAVGARELSCLTDKTRQQHETAKTKPSIDANYPFWYRGIYLFYRLYILGAGGAATFNRVALRVRNAQNRMQ